MRVCNNIKTQDDKNLQRAIVDMNAKFKIYSQLWGNESNKPQLDGDYFIHNKNDKEVSWIEITLDGQQMYQAKRLTMKKRGDGR